MDDSLTLSTTARRRLPSKRSAFVLLAYAVVFGLLWYRLGSLTYGQAADIEASTLAGAGSWQAILHNPLNAPYTVLLAIVQLTGHHGITSLRLVSTVFAAMAAGLFYVIARHWHSVRVALLATWLFVCSGWFLHTGRLGSPEILWLVGILAVVVVLTPSRRGEHRRLALPVGLLTLGLTLYIPGMVWLVVAGLVVQRSKIFETWRLSQPASRLLAIIGGSVLVAPLGYALVRSPLLLRDWLGFNSEYGTMQHIVSNIISVPRGIFLNGQYDAVHWLTGLPLLSAFEAVMCLIGLYFYLRNFRAARSRLIAVMTIIGWAVSAIAGPNAVSLVLPVMYLLVASGIAYMLHLWFSVFPNNPIARNTGIAVIIAAVMLTSFYQTRSYFIAWRYSSDTAQVFRNSL